MSDYTGFWIGLFLLLIFAILCMIIIGIGLLAGYVASAMGFHGWQWWCITLLAYIIIGGLIGAIYKIGD